VDATAAFSAASHRGRATARGGSISHYEEPCPYWKLAETKLVTDALDLDVAGGEQDWESCNLERMIGTHASTSSSPIHVYGGIEDTASREYGGCGRHALHAAQRQPLLGQPSARVVIRTLYGELHILPAFGMTPQVHRAG